MMTLIHLAVSSLILTGVEEVFNLLYILHYPGMKVKRLKHSRRVLAFYEQNFGFHKPYNVLVDGTFCMAALKGEIRNSKHCKLIILCGIVFHYNIFTVIINLVWVLSGKQCSTVRGLSS